VPGEIVIRAPRPGDGPEMAQIWLEFAAYYVALDPMAFKLPREDGLAEWFEADIVREKSPRRREVVAQIDSPPTTPTSS
jgi:hypothetical protein